MFVDDTKCYSSISSSSESEILQKDLDSIVSWSRKQNLSFNPTKSVVISYKQQFETAYNISSTQVATPESITKTSASSFPKICLGTINTNIIMLSKAYKTLGLLRRTFSRQHLPEVKKKPYLSLVRSQLIYCSIIWRPHLIKDIKMIEQLQRRATKFILNDYESDYNDHLLKLNLLPIMYTFELADIVFKVSQSSQQQF